MFKITDNKGFHITFPNYWTVSVQWGSANYCENHSIRRWEPGSEVPPCPSAECAAWDIDGEYHKFDNGDTVKGWMTAEEVAGFIAAICNKEMP